VDVFAYWLLVGAVIFAASLVASLIIGRASGSNDRALGEYPPDVEQEPGDDD
jgi:hypothetical protein